METKFGDWIFSPYSIKSKGGEYELWVANGFLSFKDHRSKISLLTGLSIYRKYLIWMEYKKECKIRGNTFLKK